VLSLEEFRLPHLRYGMVLTCHPLALYQQENLPVLISRSGN